MKDAALRKAMDDLDWAIQNAIEVIEQTKQALALLEARDSGRGKTRKPSRRARMSNSRKTGTSQDRVDETAKQRHEPEQSDLYWRLHSLSKSLESSGRIDEQDCKDAYATILDAMNVVMARKPHHDDLAV